MKMSVSQGLMPTNTNPPTKVTAGIHAYKYILKNRNTEAQDGKAICIQLLPVIQNYRCPLDPLRLKFKKFKHTIARFIFSFSFMLADNIL